MKLIDSTLLRRFALAAGMTALMGLAAPVLAQGPGPDAGAQGPRGRGPHAHAGRGHRLRAMAGELGLSDAQREQMRSILQSARAQGQALRERNDPAAIRAHRQEVRRRMEAVLTPEQRARAEQMRSQHGERALEHRMEGLSRRLGLSATQAQQVRGILRYAQGQRRTAMEAARTNGTSPRETMQSLRQQTVAQIRSVLTAEQQARFDEARAQREARGPRGRGGRR